MALEKKIKTFTELKAEFMAYFELITNASDFVIYNDLRGEILRPVRENIKQEWNLTNGQYQFYSSFFRKKSKYNYVK